MKIGFIKRLFSCKKQNNITIITDRKANKSIENLLHNENAFNGAVEGKAVKIKMPPIRDEFVKS